VKSGLCCRNSINSGLLRDKAKSTSAKKGCIKFVITIANPQATHLQYLKRIQLNHVSYFTK